MPASDSSGRQTAKDQKNPIEARNNEASRGPQRIKPPPSRLATTRQAAPRDIAGMARSYRCQTIRCRSGPSPPATAAVARPQTIKRTPSRFTTTRQAADRKGSKEPHRGSQQRGKPQTAKDQKNPIEARNNQASRRPGISRARPAPTGVGCRGST
jgi:hypothetical protein